MNTSSRLAALVLLAAVANTSTAVEKIPAQFARPHGAFVAISVGNAATAARWYVDKLGFRIVKEIGPGAYLLHGICKAGFIVEDLDAAMKRAHERNIEIKHGMMGVPEFKMRSFIIVDVEGNLIQFFGK